MKFMWAFARQSFHSTAIYRLDFWLRVFNVIIRMYATFWLWTILYTEKPGSFNLTLEQMVAYAGMANILLTIMRVPSVQYYIMMQMRTGSIELDLLKPLDFHLHMFMRSMGEVFFSIVFNTLPAFVIGFLFLGVRLPPDLPTGLLFLVSVALGLLVQFSLNFLLGTLVFFTVDMRNISWAYNSLIMFFSGAFVPLWMFPDILARIAGLMPFQSVFAIPLTIYIGKFNGIEAINMLSLQVFWCAVLILAGRLMWNAAHARLVVQGG